jgi:hypothetical protein
MLVLLTTILTPIMLRQLYPATRPATARAEEG